MNKISFTPFPNLTTRLFHLRQLKITDDNEIFILRSDKRVLQYLDIPKAETIDDARQFINKINDGIANDEWIYWAITKKDDIKLIGTICLWNIFLEHSKADIGFALLPEYFGKGVMQEVIPIVFEFGFKTMKLVSIEGDAAPDNVKSIKLMEKYGFEYDRKLEHTVVYSLNIENHLL